MAHTNDSLFWTGSTIVFLGLRRIASPGTRNPIVSFRRNSGLAISTNGPRESKSTRNRADLRNRKHYDCQSSRRMRFVESMQRTQDSQPKDGVPPLFPPTNVSRSRRQSKVRHFQTGLDSHRRHAFLADVVSSFDLDSAALYDGVGPPGLSWYPGPEAWPKGRIVGSMKAARTAAPERGPRGI
jgi:hypothetical protein